MAAKAKGENSMSVGYNFICQDCNIIYELGRRGNAKSLLPYLMKRHKYCRCATCDEDDLYTFPSRDNYYEVWRREYDANGFGYVSTKIVLNDPEVVPYKKASFWDDFRRWVLDKKTNCLRDLQLRFKMSYGLRPDWYEEDEAIDRDVERSMTRLNRFIGAIKTMDEDAIDQIIDDVLTRNRLT